MARATRLAADAEPVLGCRFVERPWQCFWERRDDLDQLELCTLERNAATEERLLHFMSAPGDPRVDPLLRVLVLRSEVDTICIRLDHVAADASGLRDCAALIASIYARLGDDPQYRPEGNWHGDRSFGQVFRQFSFADKAAALLRSRGKVRAWRFPTTNDTCVHRAFAFRRIPADRLPALRAYRLAHQATTNDVLLTAFFRALFEVIDPPMGGYLTVQFSVDLRHYLPEERAGSICNLASGVFPSIERRADEPFDATLVRVRDAMRSIEANSPGLRVTMLVEVISKLGLRLAREVASLLVLRNDKMIVPVFSNLGGLGARVNFGSPRITDGYLVGPIMLPRAFMLALSASASAITLSVGFCEPGTNRATVERLLDVIDRELPK